MTERNRWFVSLLAATVLFMFIPILSGCSANQESADYAPADHEAPATDEERGIADDVGSEAIGDSSVSDRVNDLKIIQNARITLAVTSAQEALEAIQVSSEKNDGYISNINRWQTQRDATAVRMTVRIPADNFSEFYSSVVPLGTITNSRIWSKDVTEEYIDLTARLDNLRKEEEALRGLLNEASNVDEMLSVRKQLTEIRGEIESFEGRLRYLDDRISYSTFEIELQPETLPSEVIRATGMDNLFPRMSAAFIRGTNWMLNITGFAILSFAAALPSLIVLTLIAVAVYLGVRKIRHMRNTQ